MIGWQLKAIAAAVLIAGVGYFAYQYRERGREIDSLTTQLQTATSANQSQAETIKAQSDALDQWVKVAGTPGDLAALVKAANDTKTQAEQAIRDLRAAKEKDRDLVDCMALLRTSLRRTCPSISSGLFKLAADSEDGDRSSSGAGGEAVARRTDARLRASLPIPD